MDNLTLETFPKKKNMNITLKQTGCQQCTVIVYDHKVFNTDRIKPYAAGFYPFPNVMRN